MTMATTAKSSGGTARVDPSTIREASAQDHSALTLALADAFFDDPITVWICPNEKIRPLMLRRFFGGYLMIKQRQAGVWTDAELSGAALWAPPGHWQITIRQIPMVAPALFHYRLLPRAPLVGRGLHGIEQVHPRDRGHFYLAVLGVEPSRQGSGLGSALIAPVLEICDRDGVGAYL